MKKKYFKLASLFLLSSLLIFSCNNPFNVFEESPEPLEDPSEKKYSPELENQKRVESQSPLLSRKVSVRFYRILILQNLLL